MARKKAEPTMTKKQLDDDLVWRNIVWINEKNFEFAEQDWADDSKRYEDKNTGHLQRFVYLSERCEASLAAL